MSEELNSADTALAPADLGQEVEATQSETTASEHTTDTPEKEAPADPLGLVPAKYRNADGSVNMERFVKAHLEMNKLIGKKGFIPAATVEEYEFQPGEGLSLDEERANAFKAEALSRGFTKDQYAFVMEKYASLVQEQSEAGWTAEKVQADLKQSWGEEYSSNLDTARRAFATFAPEDADAQDPVWNHPAVMKLLARIGSELGEDSLASATQHVGKEALMSETDIENIRRSPDYWTDPEKHALVTKWYEAKYR